MIKHLWINPNKSTPTLTSPTHLDILGVLSLGDPHHPQEFIDVVTGVADHPAEDDKHVVHIECRHDLVCCGLVRGHSLADECYVRVVPSVVVDKSGAVGHPCNLVAIIPPWHDSCIAGRVLCQPVVRLPEVIQNLPTPVGWWVWRWNGAVMGKKKKKKKKSSLQEKGLVLQIKIKTILSILHSLLTIIKKHIQDFEKGSLCNTNATKRQRNYRKRE